MKSFTIAILFTLLLFQAQAQSIYLNNNNSGLLGSAGYSHADDLYSIGSSIGYSPDGRFNFSGSVSNTYLEQEMTSLGLSAVLSYCIFKPQKDIPFTLVVGTGYQFSTYDSQFLTEDNANLTHQDIDLNAKLVANLKIMNLIDIYPSLSLTHVWRNVKIESTEINRDNNRDFSFYSAGVGFGYTFSENHMLVVMPRVSFSDEHETYCISLSYMIMNLI